MICRQQVAELVGYQKDFSQRGAQLVVVGNGKVEDLKKFRKVTDYEGILLTDPSRNTYNFLNFKSGLSDLMGMKSFTKSFSALSSGFMPGSLQGNALQLGGAITVMPDDTISFYFKSSSAGDHPPISALLAPLG